MESLIKNFKISKELEHQEVPTLSREQNADTDDLPSANDTKKQESITNHPFKELLLNFKPTEDQLTIVTDIKPCKPLLITPLHQILTKKDLKKLITVLKEEKTLGVDVEYSDHHYKGITCLVQFSTKENDYIIDSIVLKGHMHMLSDILLDTNIVKVFHDARNDLKWLQQDFHLFVINMFDTHKAMTALDYQKLSLDSVLQDRYKVIKDKKLQRADFSIRPLPSHYISYARIDSHFLIHFYEELKNELIQKNLLSQILDDCKKDCGVVYGEPEDRAYLSVRGQLIQRHQRQLLGLKKLNEWRHKVAEDANINVGYVLSKNNMKELVIRSPVDPVGINKIANSKYVAKDIAKIIQIMSVIEYNQYNANNIQNVTPNISNMKRK